MTLLCGAPCQQRQALLQCKNYIIAHFMISGERIKQHACLRIDENTRDNNRAEKTKMNQSLLC